MPKRTGRRQAGTLWRQSTRLAARVLLFAVFLNIILPVATVVVAPHLPSRSGEMAWAAGEICRHGQPDQAPADQTHRHGAACPLCILLGSQILAPAAAAIPLLPPSEVAEPLLPAASVVPVPSGRPRQIARGPPALI